MAHLTDLNGAPMTWDELNAKVRAWYETHDRQGNALAETATEVVRILPFTRRALPPLPLVDMSAPGMSRKFKAPDGSCWNCRAHYHGMCAGRRGVSKDQRCACALLGHKAAP